jgi:ribosomal protein S18 acetylase RimI-like enzyme
MSASALIRRLTEEDAAILKPFRLMSLEDGEDAFHSTAEEWDKPLEGYQGFIASECVFGAFAADGGMIGLAVLALTARNRTKTRHKTEIWSVYVLPKARRSGIARRLLNTCVDEARARGFEAIVITVTARNTHVVAFYESLGFRIFGTEPRMVKLADGSYRDDHLMQLDLVSASDC